MVNELIRFPQAGKTWIDTEEGGMYVFATMPRPVGHKDT